MSSLRHLELLGRGRRRTTNQTQLIGMGLFYAVLLQLCVSVLGFETYFPVSDIQITIPEHPDTISRLATKPLLQFKANKLRPLRSSHYDQDEASSESSDTDEFRYEIYNKYGLINIDPTTGQLSMTAEQIRQLGNNFTTFIVEASASAKSGQDSTSSSDDSSAPPANAAKMTLTLRTQPVKSVADFCGKSANLCFWDAVAYKIAENSVTWNQSVGALGPEIYRTLCPDLRVNYVLLNATTFFSIYNNQLYTNTRIDHDSMAPGPQLAARVQCQVTQKRNSVIQLNDRVLHFTILDRNDNAPELHSTETDIKVQLASPYFREDSEVGKGIMFSDNDSLSQNSQIDYEVLNDTGDVLLTKCQAFEVSHLGLKTSAINCKLYFSRSGVLRQSPYCVVIRASDPTVDLAQSKQPRKSASANVCLVSDLSKIHDTDRPAAQALQAAAGSDNAGKGRRNRKNRKLVSSSEEASMSDEASQMKKNWKIYYPHEVTVLRESTQMYRVIQPFNMVELAKDGGPVFRISDDRTGAFGITASAGIVYVKNVSALQTAPEMLYHLTIEWLKSSAKIVVHLEDAKIKPNFTHVLVPCSENAVEKECRNTNGFGTDGTGCVWRSNNLTTLTVNYATCSPNFATCPDMLCDPLEAMANKSEQFTCLQDCVAPKHIFGPHTVNDNGLPGIRAAAGSCTCDEFGKCACATHPESVFIVKPKKSRKNNPETTTPQVVYTVSAEPATLQAQCGVTCILLFSLCPLAFVCVVFGVIVTRRKRGKGTSKPSVGSRRSSMEDVDIQRDPEMLALTEMPADAYNRISTINSTFPAEYSFSSDADSKWEFERSQLILDTVLGEGEFGRVVKGYATDIAGTSGVRTVAVKMLKTGANSVELLALLSEFQLLQEVTHPNVIQLLGACTRESPLVIMEYAKHGSLRNYLRLSRKLECSGIEFCDGVEPVTARDILSFAWQICKGMAYLTEIKLVHRDLAARNVLLTEGKICKISDFGLTRDVYEDDAYLKRSKDRVPVKWMAPESLADHVYTSRSDVWAFGILSWELITLGASPYPGIPPQNLYHLLKTGYRMERPENCSDEIYNIVKSCWMDDPHTRPPFKWLASQWEALLGNNAKYIEVENNAVSNPLYCANNNNNNESAPLTIQQELGEPDKIDHLWHAPYSSEHGGAQTPDQSSGSGHVPLGYDIPKPLIDSRTDEQNLRYQNDIRTTPQRKNHRETTHLNGVVKLVDLSHYDTPAKRRKSYLDMSGIGRTPHIGRTPSIGYNLDVQNVDKKRLSKDITFRFSSLLNLSEQFSSQPI